MTNVWDKLVGYDRDKSFHDIYHSKTIPLSVMLSQNYPQELYIIEKC